MHHLEAPSPATLRAAVVAALPEFESSSFSVLNEGWDSVGLEADDSWIFKFPRHPAAAERLRRECRILAMVRRHADLPVPEMVLYEAPQLFSCHRKLPGTFLEPADYLPLDDRQRDAIAEKMAGLYAALHAIPHAEARAAGATAIHPWTTPRELMACHPHLPEHLRPRLEETIAHYQAIAHEPNELVYGYFDGHGWNMAFDKAAGVLNGVYDFADSGFGARHQDLSYSLWISRDLTARIIDRYERLTGMAIDRTRVALYSQMLRFVEFADTEPGHPSIPDRLIAIESWFAEAEPVRI